MGNLCGKSSKEQGSSSSTHPFARPGQTLGSNPNPNPNPGPGPSPASAPSTPPKNPRASVPPKISSRLNSNLATEDARRAAAKAAEERAAKATQAANTGKLGRNLAKEKKLGLNGQLKVASEEERGYRDADEQAERRNFN